MRILLINPPLDNIILTTQPAFVVSEKGSYPPLGLLYLATTIKQRSCHDVRVLDCQLDNKIGLSGIKQQIEDFRPDIVGITLITFMIIDAYKVAAVIRDCSVLINKKIIVVGGGPHATIFPEETIRSSYFDYVFSGEAELNFLSFIENINNGLSEASHKNIPGIHYRSGSGLVRGPVNPLIEDLDSLPLPDRRILDYSKYRNLLSGGRIMTTSITSRGCPFKCIFCDRLGKKFRAVSAQKVIEEISQCLDIGIKEIFFHDDTFTFDKARVMDICNLIKKNNLNFEFSLRSRVNTIDEEMMRALKVSGCKRISFGVESGVQKILDRIKKGTNLSQIENAFRLARKYKITTLADFMIGLPDESMQDILMTIKFSKKIRPDYAQFSITTPYPATQLYQEALREGVLKKDVWKEFAECPSMDFSPPRWNKNFSSEELARLLNKCYRDFYFNFTYIRKSLTKPGSIKGIFKKVKAGINLLKNT